MACVIGGCTGTCKTSCATTCTGSCLGSCSATCRPYCGADCTGLEKINIIIPCFYEDFYLTRCLTSLAEQTYKEHLEIYLINDCSSNTTDKYNSVINQFKKYLNIHYLETKQNSGPGIARQLGLDSIDNNYRYVMFIDDDDVLYDNNVIEHFYGIINEDDYTIISGLRKDEEQNEGLFFTGILFDRNVIRKANLHFEEEISFFEEDSEFLNSTWSWIQCQNEINRQTLYKIHYGNFISYIHSEDNPNSLTKNVKNPLEMHQKMIAKLLTKLLNYPQLTYFLKRSIQDMMTDDIKEKYPELCQKLLERI